MTEQKKYRLLRTAVAITVTLVILIGCMYLPTVLAEASAERRISEMIPLAREPLSLSSGNVSYTYSQRLQVLTNGPLYYTQMDFDAMTDRYYGYSELYLTFLSELWKLVQQGLLTREFYFTFTEVGIDQAYYYVHDFLNESGFFVAELTVNLSDGNVKLLMDPDSGHLIYLSCTGPRFCSENLIPVHFLADSAAQSNFGEEFAQYLALTNRELLHQTDSLIQMRCETDDQESLNILLQYDLSTPENDGSMMLCLSDLILP